MPRSYTSLLVHYVFSTKNREPMIDPDLQPRLFEYIGGLCRARKSVLLAAGGMPDHTHLLVGLSKEESVASFIGDIKSLSSGWVHKTFRNQQKFKWQEGYGGFTVSYSAIDAIKRYFVRQPIRHRRQTFKEEFVELLKNHKIEYDERYLWD